ncbi:response regulator transcription factor [uncultured Rothia sp.]|uniref:response regulator transcription factor n=1 Tax=uncultured Rothia sp. TaxID=316088 RepID=UPI003217760B
MNQPISVMVVDDQQLVRSGLGMLLNSQPDIQVIAQCADGQDAVEQFSRTASASSAGTIDVVLMDVRMPRMDGLEAARQILVQEAETKVIMLSTFDIDDYVFEAIRSGASGFLLKDAPPEELLNAIRTVFRGDGVIAPSATKRLMEHMTQLLPHQQTQPSTEQQPHAEKIASLTAREHEILLLMAQGLSNGELCQRLFVSEATVKTHVSHILAKLAARDRVQAVVVAYEAGLMD